MSGKKLNIKVILCSGVMAFGASPLLYAGQVEEVILPTVHVDSGRDTAVTDYYISETSAVTKTGTPQREIPQSVRVLTRQALDDTGSVRLDDSLAYVSGVSRQHNFGGLWDNIAIRGFAGNENTGMSMLRNGFQDNRGYNAPRDLANVQSIEFLKGPSAALYGNSEPGGTLNIVTKKPQYRAGHQLQIETGSYDRHRMALDTTGPIGQGIAYRLNLAAEDKGNFRDYAESERLLVAPALSWVSGNSLLSYDGEYLRQKAPLDRGITMVNGRLFAVPRENFLGSPADGDVVMQNQTHQLTLEHEFSPQWKATLGTAYKHNTLEGWASEITLFTNVNNLASDSVNLRRRYRDFSSDDVTLRGEVQGRFDLAGLPHTVIAGTEAYRYELDEVQRRINNAVRVDNITSRPVYTVLATGSGTLIQDRTQQQDSMAFYLQDEINLAERWKLLLGLRHDRFDQEIRNHRNGSVARLTQSALSPRTGLTFLIDPRWSWYASAGKSFRPNPDTDASGNLFDPEEGRALETGLKYESPDKRLGATVSLFRIDKKNVLTGSDPDGVFSVAAGEARSQGVEFDLSGKLIDRLRISASYAYTDTEVMRDAGGAVDWISGEVISLKGKSLSNVPRQSASVFSIWEVPLANGGSWGAGGGLTYVGERAGNYIDSFRLPSYTTVQLASYWNIDRHWRVTFNVNNLFDREYIASSYDRQWLTPGAPRVATFGAVYRF